MTSDQNNFKELLDAHYVWPSQYSYKFIVKIEQIDLVLGHFNMNEVQVEKRPSKKGNYISLTITKLVQSSDEVIETYEKLQNIEGIIKL